MTTYAGPILTLDSLVYNLDAINVYSWNVGRKIWSDLSTKKNNSEFINEPALDNVNGAFNFANGNSQHVRFIPFDGTEIGNFEFLTGDFTIEVWIYPESFATYTHMFCLNNQSTFALKADITTGNIYFTSTAFNTFNHAGLSTWTLNLNQWNHVVLKRQSGVAYGYLNGVLRGSKTGFTNNIPGDLNVLIRNGGVAEYSQCKIRTVRAYKKALSDSEVLRNYINFAQRTYKPPTVTQVFSTAIAVASRSTAIGVAISPYIPVTATGGFGKYTYSISPALPSGVLFDIDTGEITGISTAISSINYTITVKDALGASSSRTISFNIIAPPIVLTRIIAAQNLPVNQSGVNFTPIVGSDGFGILTYSISPALPTGLNFNTSTGAITGTPTALRSSTTFTVTVTDQVTPTPQTASNTFTLSVFPAPLTVTVSESSLNAFVNAAFTATPVTASGGFGALTYSISSALPAGLSLNTSTGAITGTPTAVQGTTSRNITVTDQTTPTAQTGAGSFTLTVAASLYSFSTFTFTTGGTTGNTGPSLATMLSSYNTVANPWLNNSSYFNVVGGQQYWTVPITGAYRIEAKGARGGNGAAGSGGPGATIAGDFTLTQGEIIYILVGQPGGDRPGSDSNSAGAGGGGTYVVRTPYNTNGSILVIAGGGGGSGSASGGGAGQSGNAGQSGLGSPPGVGGTNGGGGGGGQSGIAGNGATPGGNGSSCSFGAGGGGFFSRGGANCSGAAPLVEGQSFISGGLGGPTDTGRQGAPGGFGGGGGVGHRPPGGGGYSGGGGCGGQSGGGGGGSFNSGTNVSNVSGNNAGPGQVIITKL